MAKAILRNVGLYLGKLRLASVVNQFDFGAQAAEVDVSNFEGEGWAEILPGLLNLSATFQGYWEPGDAVTGEPEASMLAAVGGSTPPVVVVKPAATLPAAADLAWFARASVLSWEFGAKLGDAYRLKLGVKANTPAIRGKVLEYQNGTSGPATGTGTAVEIAGGVPSGKSLWLAVSAFSAAGTSPTLDLVVQSDDAGAFSTPVTRATVPQFTAPGFYFAEVAGPITETYFRVSRTVTGAGATWGYVVALGVL